MPRTARMLFLPLAIVISGCLPGPAGILGPTSPPLSNEGGPAGYPGPPTLMSPAPPSPHSHTQLPNGQGEVYVLTQTIYHQAPDEAPRALYQMADRTSFVHVAPDLSYVLLHERLPEVLQAQPIPPIPTPMKVEPKPQPGSRLVKQPLKGGDRQILIERFYNYDLTLQVAPDQRTAAVITRLEPDMGGKRPLYLLDLESGELTPVAPDHWIVHAIWSPNGERLAVIGHDNVPDPMLLYVVEKAHPTLRTAHTLGSGVQVLAWLTDNQTVLGTRHEAKYEGVARFIHYPVDGGAPREVTVDVSAGEDPAKVHVGGYRPSPDGTRLVASRMTHTDGRMILIDHASERWSYLSRDGEFTGWSEEGEPLCRSADPALPAPCATEAVQ